MAVKDTPRHLVSLTFATAVFGLSSQLAVAAEWQKHIDRQNGFAVMYDSALTPIAPNESVTKLSLTSGDGQRCTVIVVPNPLATEENSSQTVEWMVNNRKRLESEYAKSFKNVTMEAPAKAKVAGKFDAALLTYSFKYEALGAELAVTVIEAHLPIRGNTYKFGCSTGMPPDDLFENRAANFIRGFQLIPIEN